MTAIYRVSGHMLNVLGVLLTAHEQGEKLHGYRISELSGETSGTVYPMLGRMEAEGWVARKGETVGESLFRRLCWLTPDGVAKARDLLDRPEPRVVTGP